MDTSSAPRGAEETPLGVAGPQVTGRPGQRACSAGKVHGEEGRAPRTVAQEPAGQE